MDARGTLTLAVVPATMALLLLDATVVNVALEAIRGDPGADLGELQWVIGTYRTMTRDCVRNRAHELDDDERTGTRGRRLRAADLHPDRR